MSLNRPVSRSKSQKRFSREGFQPLATYNSNPNMASTAQAHGANNAGDATIDIPLQQVTSNGQQGLRTQASTSALNQSTSNTASNEKAQHFARFRGRRQRHPKENVTGVGYDGEEDTLTTMGKVYNKVLNCEWNHEAQWELREGEYLLTELQSRW